MPEVSGIGGRRSLWWFGLVGVIALGVVMVAFADRFPNLTAGSSSNAPAEQVREAGTFVPTPASAMPESMTNKAGTNKAGGDAASKPGAKESAAPPVNNTLPSAAPPSGARPRAAAKPSARRAKSRVRKGSARQRSPRNTRAPIYNPRYN